MQREIKESSEPNPFIVQNAQEAFKLIALDYSGTEGEGDAEITRFA